MKTIFFSGSRGIKNLTPENLIYINECINNNFRIIIWDADWADTLIQKYLTEKKYSNVSIFTINKIARNNIGNSEVIYCKIPDWTFSKAVFSVKDEEMRKICSEGYVIWDWESKWTENNIKNLLKKGKKVTISIAGENIQWPNEEPFSKGKIQEKILQVNQSSLFH